VKRIFLKSSVSTQKLAVDGEGGREVGRKGESVSKEQMEKSKTNARPSLLPCPHFSLFDLPICDAFFAALV